MRTIEELVETIAGKDGDELRKVIHNEWTFGEVFAYRQHMLPGGADFDLTLCRSDVFSSPRVQNACTVFDLEINACFGSLGKEFSEKFAEETPQTICSRARDAEGIVERVARELSPIKKRSDGKTATINKLSRRVKELEKALATRP